MIKLGEVLFEGNKVRELPCYILVYENATLGLYTRLPGNLYKWYNLSDYKWVFSI